MGRKTFESIVAIIGKPLPNRPNIVLTRDATYTYDNVEVATSLEEGLEKAIAHNPTEIHIGGGAEIYKQALPYVDQLKLTFIHSDEKGDAFFPEFEKDFKIVHEHPVLTHDDLKYQWVDYVRKR